MTFDEKWAFKAQLRKEFEQRHKRDVKRSFIIGYTGDKFMSSKEKHDDSYDEEFLIKQRKLLNILLGVDKDTFNPISYNSDEEYVGKMNAATHFSREREV